MRTLAGAIVAHAGAVVFAVGIIVDGAEWYKGADYPDVAVAVGIGFSLAGLVVMGWGLATERPKAS